MLRKNPAELQTNMDICRAEFLVALAQGLTRQASVDALKYRAAVEGLSVHAAALVVLSVEPTDDVLTARPSRPAQPPTRRHLHALRSIAAEQATTTTNGVPVPPQRGRHQSH